MKYGLHNDINILVIPAIKIEHLESAKSKDC